MTIARSNDQYFQEYGFFYGTTLENKQLYKQVATQSFSYFTLTTNSDVVSVLLTNKQSLTCQIINPIDSVSPDFLDLFNTTAYSLNDIP